MKLGLDYHGVITANPAFFAGMTQALVKEGWEIHVLTGSKVSEEFIGQLKEWGVSYTHLFSITDFHESLGHRVEWTHKGPWIREDLWNQTKAKYCEQYGIGLHLDDSDVYGKFFKTPYARFKCPT